MQCPKCKIELKRGIAMQSAVVGCEDFSDGKVATWHEGGPGTLIVVMKCPGCGYSVRGGRDDKTADN